MKTWMLVLVVLALTSGVGCGAKQQAPATAAAAEPVAQPVPEKPVDRAPAASAPPDQTVAARQKPIEMQDGPVIEGDEFAKGKEWGGNRIEVNMKKPKMRLFSFVVTKRSGDQLQAVFDFPILSGGGKYPKFPVHGTAPASGDGDVRLSTIWHLDSSQISLEGKIEGGELWLVYNGYMFGTGEAFGAGMMKVKEAAPPEAPRRRRVPPVRNFHDGETRELKRLLDSEYFTKAGKLLKNTKDSLAAQKAGWEKEAEQLTEDQLSKALGGPPPKTVEDRTKFAIYCARLQKVRAASMSPEEKLARIEMLAYLLSEHKDYESDAERRRQAREDWERYIRNRALAESEMKGKGQ